MGSGGGRVTQQVHGEGTCTKLYFELLHDMVARGMSRQAAASRINKRFPSIREGMVREANPRGPAGRPVK
jgi:hypothetical protein